MNDTERIYSLLSHSNGLKIRAISEELELDRSYVAELLFSTENHSLWFQDDDSLWFAKEGALHIEEPEEELDELFAPIEIPQRFNIDKFYEEDISDSLKAYLFQITKFRIYSSEETSELFRRYHDGDRKAFDLLLKSQQRLVANIALFYSQKGVTIEDLIQEGNIGLIRAIELYDDTINYSFSSYAKTWILQAILLSLSQLPLLVRIPLNYLSLYWKVQRYKEEYEQKVGFEPSADEIIVGDEVDSKKIASVNQLPNSLREMVVLSDDLDYYIDENNLIEEFEKNDYTKNYCANLLNFLNKREMSIIKANFGIDEAEKTLEEIGDKYGLTRERVRQIKERTIRKLRVVANAVNNNKKYIKLKYRYNYLSDDYNADELNKFRTEIKETQRLRQAKNQKWDNKDTSSDTKKDYLITSYTNNPLIDEVKRNFAKENNVPLTKKKTIQKKTVKPSKKKVEDRFPVSKDTNLNSVEKKQLKTIITDNGKRDLDYYSNLFKNLRTSNRLGKKAPHKAILLLACIQYFEKNNFSSNAVYLSEVTGFFKKIWATLLPNNSVFINDIGMPFWHMKSEPFWKLQSKWGEELNKKEATVSYIERHVAYALIDKELVDLLKDESNRKELINILTTNYIDPLIKKEEVRIVVKPTITLRKDVSPNAKKQIQKGPWCLMTDGTFQLIVDKKTFNSYSIAIPQEFHKYWGADTNNGTSYNTIKVLHDGKTYKSTLSVLSKGDVILFWGVSLREQLKQVVSKFHNNICLRFKKTSTKDKYVLSVVVSPIK